MAHLLARRQFDNENGAVHEGRRKLRSILENLEKKQEANSEHACGRCASILDHLQCLTSSPPLEAGMWL